jgi:hypothetical protein
MVKLGNGDPSIGLGKPETFVEMMIRAGPAGERLLV